MIIVSGMTGIGKTTVSKLLSEELNTKVFYESVDIPILPLFYSSTEEEIQKNRYPFLLQLTFLINKFKTLKEASLYKYSIVDRSIYEDFYFCKRNAELGRISKIEMDVYESLFNTLVSNIEINCDLHIYLRGEFDEVLKRIKLRGREYEVNDELKNYYRFVWEGYDEWIYSIFDKSQLLIIDADKIDVLNNYKDKNEFMEIIKNKLNIVCK